VKLEQNYRSTKTILAAANEVIANNKLRHGKQLWSQMGAGDLITHAVAATPEDEAKWVAREIHQMHQEGRAWQDIAVMYRSNIQAKVLEEELRQASVPYVMYGGQQFFERKEVKDLLAYLRVAINPRDELALRRIINYRRAASGATTVDGSSARRRPGTPRCGMRCGRHSRERARCRGSAWRCSKTRTARRRASTSETCVARHATASPSWSTWCPSSVPRSPTEPTWSARRAR
jgi:hypothetical protein